MDDARVFNVTDDLGILLCPVCGYRGYSDAPAYLRQGGRIGDTICDCCLWQPGYDDCPNASDTAEATIIASIKSYRANWLITAAWQGPNGTEPEGFDGTQQLAALARLAPHLF